MVLFARRACVDSICSAHVEPVWRLPGGREVWDGRIVGAVDWDSRDDWKDRDGQDGRSCSVHHSDPAHIRFQSCNSDPTSIDPDGSNLTHIAKMRRSIAHLSRASTQS